MKCANYNYEIDKVNCILYASVSKPDLQSLLSTV